MHKLKHAGLQLKTILTHPIAILHSFDFIYIFILIIFFFYLVIVGMEPKFPRLSMRPTTEYHLTKGRRNRS